MNYTVVLDSSEFANEWTNFLITIDYTNHLIEFFKNGISFHDTTIDNSIIPNVFTPGGQYKLGVRYDNTYGAVNSIDDFTIYNRVLNNVEIQDLYNDGYCYEIIYDTVYVSVTDTLIIDVTLTGVPAPNNINTVKVYPNPTSDFVIINTGNYESMDGYQIKIYNTLSQLVWETFIEQEEYQIDVNTFGEYGTYFIQIYDDSETLLDVRKLILQ